MASCLRCAALLLVLAAPAVMASTASAIDTQWTGATDGLWTTAGNWDQGVPTSTDNAFLPAPVTTNATITLPGAAVANRLTVSGSGYSLTTGTLTLSDNFYVDSTSAAVDISSGALVTSPNATIGISSGNIGNSLSVGSRLSVPGTLNVGYDGTGNSLAVLASGSVSAGGLWIGGVASSASNTVTVASGGSITTTSSLLVGYGGDSNEIQVSGRVSSSQTVLGYDTGSDGNIATVAAGGRWTNAGALTVGRSSNGNSFRVTSGTLTVTGTANDVVVGDGAAAGGNSIVVTGGTFSSQAALVIGKSGTGNSFSATAGAKVSSANVRFGLNAGSTGNTGTVDGAGTVWTITNKLRVGSDGNDNTLSITNGGVVNVASDVFVGGTSNGSTVSGNSITVSGSGSKLAILSGTADLVISYGTGTANIVTVADSGTLAVSSVKIGPSGTLKIGTGAAPGSVTPSATIDSPLGGGDLVLDHNSSSYTFANPITGSVRVTQRGAGKTILSGSNSYSGATIVAGGTLALSAATSNIASSASIDVAAGSILDVAGVTGGFELASSQTLSGEGGIIGGVKANAGSTIAPAGSGIGALSFSSTLSLSGTLGIGLSGTTTDLASIAGTLTLDPASTVIFSVGSPLNEPFYVFATYGSLAGTFGTVSGLPTGYTLDYNYLAGNQIALVAVPEPSTLALAAAGCLTALAIARRTRRRG
ncbi:MAG: autotransporter-associated beta strand repeat-containing protein [Planctomycetia bacterium]|nr:autotransporter-associated beta strand repeat-containing protein [Planctomycetia bacterium]